jgi:hypothetical protein
MSGSWSERKEADGKGILESVHTQLKGRNIWVWPQSCIEHVLGTTHKGEDAIVGQKEALQKLGADQIEQQMPALKECSNGFGASKFHR